MSIINFSIPKTLEKRVENAIQKKGFSSKAEFFRMAAMYFLDANTMPMTAENTTQYLIEAIKQEVVQKYRGKKIPSVEKQLADI